MMLSAAQPHPLTPFSVVTFLELCAMFSASCWVYYVLDRRWTVKRYWSNLQDWAREHGYKVRSLESAQLPAPLAKAAPSARICAMLSNESTSILQIETDGVGDWGVSVRWNFLVR